MKSKILLLCLIIFSSYATQAQQYKHKPEAEIAVMTPAQRVDEYANEQSYHKYDISDEHSGLIEKYIWLDGVKALPRIIEIIDEYDPTRRSGKNGRKGERFDGAWMLLSDLDNHVIRLRSSEQGMKAIDALERAVERMRAAGYGKPDQDDWDRHGRFESVVDRIKYSKGVNSKDRAIKETLRIVYKVNLSEAETLELSNFLTIWYPHYPSWSDLKNYFDETQKNSAGYSLQFLILKKPERYYEAYQEFKRLNEK